jgi:hypothetical protein
MLAVRQVRMFSAPPSTWTPVRIHVRSGGVHVVHVLFCVNVRVKTNTSGKHDLMAGVLVLSVAGAVLLFVLGAFSLVSTT